MELGKETDKPSRLSLTIAFVGVVLAILSLGWQVFDKLYSSRENLQSILTATSAGALMIEVVNKGAVNGYVEVPYLHLVTENGKGYGFYFNDNGEKARLLIPGDKATFVCRSLEDWQVTGFIAPQRVRRASVTVNSARDFIRIYDLASAKWKKRLRSIYSRSTERYDEIAVDYVYRHVDFRSRTTNGITHFLGEFYIPLKEAQQQVPADSDRPRR